MKKTLNEMAAEVHLANKKWWEDLTTGQPISRNAGELLMLVITEFGEAVEGIRKNLMDDKLPHRRMEEVEIADAYIRLLDYAGGFKLNLAGVVVDTSHPGWPEGDNKAEHILMLSMIVTACYPGFHGQHPGESTPSIIGALKFIELYCAKFGLDLEGAMTEKLAYNAVRVDHTHEHRAGEHGKKF